ncbi:hypothetical protein HX833_00340 [Marine Group I thaumarchaeote]|uniref:Uncharacterized protein n=1 Tax=Marine Group I thaumarchaeote TaxID=2511932 RepID=A0A7K4NND6_9ARCH|nr:hypothetical protein [Marine Group I thaumarchaeote]
MNRYARIDDKEKLRMAKNLVKSNNKKIKKALDHINRFLAEREESKNELPIFLSDITDIKEILETGKLPDYK